MSEEFYNNLKKTRLERGFTQIELANKLGVAKSTYSMYESGKREPNIKTIKKIADLLNTSVGELLGIDDQHQTIAAHFAGDEYTEEELAKIREFAAFVRTQRK